MTDLKHPIINASDRHSNTGLYLMWAGAYGDTKGYVWADSCESAFEVWVEYLDEHAPGCLVSHEDFIDHLADAIEELAPDYVRRESEPTTMAGTTWFARDHKATVEAFQADHALCGVIDSELAERVLEHAEADLIIIGHTSLKHGSHIASHEWGFDEIEHDSDEYRSVHAESAREVLTSEIADIQAQLADLGPGKGVLSVRDLMWEVGESPGWSVCYQATGQIPECSGCSEDGCDVDCAERCEALAQQLIESVCEAIAKG